MDVKIIEIVKDWFIKADDWQKDAFVNLWRSKNIEDVKTRTIKLVYKEYGYASCAFTCDTKFPEDLDDEISDRSCTMLKSISNIQGVGALNPTRPLEFSDGLNIVFGANGCGKSSYVKVLKKAENPKDDTNIHSNIFQKDAPPTKATIVFSEDGNDTIVNWSLNNKKILPIRIYDTKVAKRFVEQSNETVYEPKLLNVFTQLAEVIDYIGLTISEEYNKNINLMESFPEELKDSSVFLSFSDLSSLNAVDDFEKIVAFSESDKKELTKITKHFLDTNPTATKNKLSTQNEILKKLKKQIEDLFSELDNSKIELYLKARKKQIETREAFECFLSSLKSISTIEEFGNEPWKEMWESSEKFSATIKNRNNNICVLCQQELSDDANKRMKKFSEIYSYDLEKRQSEAHDAFVHKTEELGKLIYEGLNINKTKQMLITNAFEEEFVSYVESIMEQLLSRANWLYNYESSGSNCPAIEKYEVVEKRLNEEINNNSDEIISLNDFIENYEKQSEKKLILESKQWLSKHKDVIIQKRKCVILKGIQPKLKTNTITKTKNKLSEKMITEVYINRFNSELDALNPSHSIKVELIADGKKGITSHKVSIKGAFEKKKTEEILSEGEYRVVSIAAFLADLNSLNKTQAFIFDDPITSLDHNYEDNVAKQLVKLSFERQVIVFTHRIAFAETLSFYMEEYCKDNTSVKPSLNYIELTNEPMGEPITKGKYNSLSFEKELNKIKNEDIPKVKKLKEAGDYDLSKSKMESICSRMRNNIEDGIGKVLLSGIITRYSKTVYSLKIRYLDVINSDDVRLFEKMMTKYSFQVHNQPSEKPVFLPALDDVENDIDELLKWNKCFKKRIDEFDKRNKK